MAPTNKYLGATQMAGAHMFQAVQHPKLDTLGLVAIRDFLKKRARYLRLVAQNNKADGVNVTPITVVASNDPQLLENLINMEKIDADSVDDCTDEGVMEYLESTQERDTSVTAEYVETEVPLLGLLRYTAQCCGGRKEALLPSQDRGVAGAHHAEHGDQVRKRQADVQCDGNAHVSGDSHYAIGASVHAWSATDHCRRRNGPSVDWKAGLGRDGFCEMSASGLFMGQTPP
jgi:hypothetical protein